MDSGGPKGAQVQSYAPGGASVPSWRIGVTWRIWLNRSSAAAIRPYVQLLWPLFYHSNLTCRHTAHRRVGPTMLMCNAWGVYAWILLSSVVPHSVVSRCLIIELRGCRWIIKKAVMPEQSSSRDRLLTRTTNSVTRVSSACMFNVCFHEYADFENKYKHTRGPPTREN